MPAEDDLSNATERLRTGAVSSRELVELLLTRIAADTGPDALHAVLETNPDALADAARLDVERSTGRVRGPLHGMPLLIKDNVDTAAPLHTTGGSSALKDTSPLRDAEVVARVRAAGLVVLGKSNLSEWANYRSTHSISGWSAVGGLTRNPHHPTKSAGGSSSGSGSAVAAGLAPMAVGTETDGSIICPAAFCGIVGLKPTLGLVPTTGVIPIARSQDVVGPMTRTVRDAALLLAAMVGEPGAAGLDPAQSEVDHAPLRGARLGVPRVGVWTSDARVSATVEAAIAVLESLGATIVDPVEIPNLAEIADADELTVLDHEVKAGLADYLATRPPGGPRTLADLIAFNREHADVELSRFDQDIFERAQETTGLDAADYLAARARCLRRSRDEGLDVVFAEHRLDALVMPSADLAFDLIPTGDRDRDQGADYTGSRMVGPTSLPAMAGYPMLTVPCGVVDRLPVGLGFVGRANRERLLLRLGHAYELAAFGSDGSAAAFPPPPRPVG
jgi:amidase